MSRLPIIATGMALFLTCCYVDQLLTPEMTAEWALAPVLLAAWPPQLGRLTSYPLVHFSPLHLLGSLVFMWPCLAEFERAHGSLHTAIVMNTTAAISGVVYTALALALHVVLGASSLWESFIGGASVWCMVFFTVHCYRSKQPKLLPLAYVVANSVVMFSAESLVLHLVAYGVGVLVAQGKLGPLCTPPHNIVERVETSKPFAKLLSLKDMFVFDGEPLFLWVYESEARDCRYQPDADTVSVSLLPV